MTAEDLKEQSIIDEIVPEPIGGAHRKPDEIYETVYDKLVSEIKKLSSIKPDKLVRKRREKFYGMGVWTEEK